MTVCLIGVHYPRADYFSEFVKTVRTASDRLLGTPGCLSAEWWVTTDQEAVVSVAHFTSDEAVSTARVKVRESNLVDGYGVRTCQPPQIVVVEAGD
jgi:quinol monooxygenase YgiN